MTNTNIVIENQAPASTTIILVYILLLPGTTSSLEILPLCQTRHQLSCLIVIRGRGDISKVGGIVIIPCTAPPRRQQLTEYPPVVSNQTPVDTSATRSPLIFLSSSGYLQFPYLKGLCHIVDNRRSYISSIFSFVRREQASCAWH